ncbi:MAG: hypothetical protein AABY32_02405 [Nanoarchaeota archaeon]
MKEYVKSQLEEIFKYKWIESEKEGHDIGEDAAARKWIELYAEKFRQEYDEMVNRIINEVSDKIDCNCIQSKDRIRKIIEEFCVIFIREEIKGNKKIDLL